MTNNLVIGGGGSVIVASDDLLDRVQRLENMRDVALATAAQLGIIDGFITPSELRLLNVPVSAMDAESDLRVAIEVLTHAGELAGRIASAVRASLLVYGAAEEAKKRTIRHVSASIAYSGAAALPLVMLPLIPLVPVAAGAVAVGIVASGSPEELVHDLQEALAAHNEIITNPEAVAALRLMTGSLDDAMAGLLQVPPAIALLLGDSGIGLTGVDTAATVITGAGVALGFFTENGVTVRQASKTKTSARGGPPPATYEERVARIPKPTENGGSQVRVDRYSAPGRPDRFEVYLSGTQDFDARETSTPFDLTSNVRGIAGLPNGSLRATMAALDKAGVTKESPITFTGHSQGGLLAHELAASGRYNTWGVLEVGAPASQTRLAAGVPEVAIEHDNDIVTGLGGDRANNEAIIVRRDPFENSKIPKDETVPAHARDEYRKTAALVDTASSEKTIDALEKMNKTGKGAEVVTSFLFTAKRTAKK